MSRDDERKCKNCGRRIRKVNYLLGPKWMHIAPGDNFGSEYWDCRRTVAQPEPEGEKS